MKALPKLPAESIDAIVTDPPYGLGFMGKDWDSPRGADDFPRRRAAKTNTVDTGVACKGGRRRSREGCTTRQARDARSFQSWNENWAREALRVLKPGGFLLAFGGTRTFHRLTCALEDAGFDIRDCVCWLYAQGFPKSLDVSKAIDRQRADRSLVLKATAWTRDRLAELGLTSRDLDEALGTNGMGGHYTARDAQAAIPTAEAWKRLVPLLGEPPAWMPRLPARTPGEAWKHREIVSYVDVPVGCVFGGPTYGGDSSSRRVAVSTPATDDAQRWIGWGTALKPSWEPIVVARKPLDGTVAENVLMHSTGAMNIHDCRIGFACEADERESKTKNRHAHYGSKARKNRVYGRDERTRGNYDAPGRWPANVALTHTTDCRQVGHTRIRSNGHHPATRGAGGLGTAGHKGQGGLAERRSGELVGCWECSPDCPVRMLDEQGGGASRFFYCAKASRSERNAGLGGLDNATTDDGRHKPIDNPYLRGKTLRQNVHPTVKPIALMRYLVRLVTPPGGIVLDPFAGSGSTGCAAVLEGARFVGFERESAYVPIARARIKHSAQTERGRSQ